MEQKKATLHAKIGVLNFGGKKYTTQAKRSLIKTKDALTKNQEAAVAKKANDMMRKYNAMNNQNQKNVIRAKAVNNGNVYAYFVKEATKKVLRGSPKKITYVTPERLMLMMKTPKPTDKKTYVHEKVVADPVAGKKLIKKIRGNVKKTIKKTTKNGAGMGVMGNVQNAFNSSRCVHGSDRLYKPTELRVIAARAGVPAAQIEQAKRSRIQLCELIKKAKMNGKKPKTPSPSPKRKTPSPSPKRKTPSPKNVSRIRDILNKQPKRKVPGVFAKKYGACKPVTPPKYRSPTPNNNNENYNNIIPWELRSPISQDRHRKLQNKVYYNYLKELKIAKPVEYVKEIGRRINKIARKSMNVKEPYKTKNLENIVSELTSILKDVTNTNNNLRKIIKTVVNKK